jgi:hypothetical protein
MSPRSVILTRCYLTWWYSNVLFAFYYGDRCRWLRIYDLADFNASNSALLATAFGASSTRWRSYACGVIRLNSVRFTLELSGSITLAIIVCQSCVCSNQPRLLYVSWVLLM